MFSIWKKWILFEPTQNKIEIEPRIGQKVTLKWTSFDQKKRYKFNLEITAVEPYSKIPKFLAPKFKFRIWFCLIEAIHFLSFLFLYDSQEIFLNWLLAKINYIIVK